MKPVIIFLDIDGVLNGHEWMDDAESNRIRPECVAHLNRIARATGASLVISSAWRYMIHGEAMTLAGFGYMLRTHGVVAAAKVVGLTCRDEEVPDRGEQISLWLWENHRSGARYVVIDDDDFGISRLHPLIRTDGRIGLTGADADLAIATLGGSTP